MLEKYLPITAIIIFLIKELIEFFKRKRSDDRKIDAIKHFISRDLEICAFCISNYHSIIHVFLRTVNENGRKIVVVKKESGNLHYDHWHPNDDRGIFRSGGKIFAPSRRFIDKYMLEIATLDATLYKATEAASDAIYNLEHFRESIIDYAGIHEMMDGFISYAEEELKKIELAIAALYKECTGKPTIERRLH